MKNDKRKSVSEQIRELRDESENTKQDFDVLPVADFYKKISSLSKKENIGKKFLIVNDRQMTIAGLIQVLEPPKVYIRQERYDKTYETNDKQASSPDGDTRPEPSGKIQK